MKYKVMKAWVKELRSGDWEQGRKQLDQDGKLCCLGVLSLMAACEGVCEITPGTENAAIGCAYGERQDSALLPLEVRKWSGVKSRSGQIFGAGKTLTALNDHGATFAEIADIIEKHWKAL